MQKEFKWYKAYGIYDSFCLFLAKFVCYCLLLLLFYLLTDFVLLSLQLFVVLGPVPLAKEVFFPGEMILKCMISINK